MGAKMGKALRHFNHSRGIGEAQMDIADSPVAPVPRVAYFSAMKSAALKEQFVTDAKGKRVGVLLDLKTFERMCEAQEELADIQAYDAARPKIGVELLRGNFTTLSDLQKRRANRK